MAHAAEFRWNQESVSFLPLPENSARGANSARPILDLKQNGKPFLDLHGGFRDARHKQPWTADTLVLIWSATKGLGAACLLHTLQEHKIGIERRVAEFWPEFAQAGKDKITLAQLLSHQAGLAALDDKVDVLDYAAVIRALEKQTPLWPPGTAHGYHARTFGFLLDELIRRIALTSAGEYWRKIFADPLNLDIWIGLPEEAKSPCRLRWERGEGRRQRIPAQFTATSLRPEHSSVPFTSPAGLRSVSKMNTAASALPFVSFRWNRPTCHRWQNSTRCFANGGRLDGRQFLLKPRLTG